MFTRKRSTTGIGALAVVMALVTAACGGSGDGGSDNGIEERTLSYASMIPEDTPHMEFLLAWQDQVTEATDGKITFENYFSASLCEATEIGQCVKDGRADLGWTASIYTPANFPASMITNLPFATTNTQAKIDAMYELATTNESIIDEYAASSLHFLYMSPSMPHLLVSKEPLDSIDDIKGLKVAANANQAVALKALGAEPVSLGPADLYENLERGVVDAVANALDVVNDYRLYEVADHFYTIGEYQGSPASLHQVINLDLWNSLEPEVQEAMTEVSAELSSTMLTDHFVDYDEQHCATLAENAETFESLGPKADFEAWAAEVGDDLVAGWRTTAEEAGVADVEGIETQFFDLISEYEESVEAPPSSFDTCVAAFEKK